MAAIYDMCAVAEVIYCDIKNINGQYNVAKKIHLEVIIKTHLPLTGFLLVIFATKKNHLLEVISDQMQKGKLKL